MVIIAITGVPGTGKTTIAKKLAEYLDAIYINLVEFAKKHKEKYIIGYDDLRETYIIDDEKLIKDIEKFIEENRNRNIIIDGHFSHLIGDEYLDLIVYLKADPNVIFNRLKERGYPYHKIFENVFVENLDLISDDLSNRNTKILIIDTTDISVNEALNTILDKLKTI